METDISPGLSYRINDRWSALGGVFFKFAGESGADTGDSLTIGGYAGARYAPSNDFSLTFGVLASDRLEDDAVVIPALGLDWKVDEKVRFTISPGVGGVGFRVTHQTWEQVALLADGVYQSREFRLNDGAPLPDGIVKDTRFMLGAGVVWTPSEKIEITARAGAVVSQSFEISDSAGNELSDPDSDPTPYVYVGGSIRF